MRPTFGSSRGPRWLHPAFQGKNRRFAHSGASLARHIVAPPGSSARQIVAVKRDRVPPDGRGAGGMKPAMRQTPMLVFRVLLILAGLAVLPSVTSAAPEPVTLPGF